MLHDSFEDLVLPFDSDAARTYVVHAATRRSAHDEPAANGLSAVPVARSADRQWRAHADSESVLPSSPSQQINEPLEEAA